VESLVRESALPRRDVEEFLASLQAGSADLYRRLLAEYMARRPALAPEDEAALEGVAAELIAGVPAPRKRFDHVQATPRTLVRRVKWLTSAFDLTGRSVLFAGDHDVTSLVLARVVPDATLTVVDIDERLLSYIGEKSGPADIGCVFSDLRFGLPPALKESADLVFTDLPYTPEGLSLFLSRSLAALRRGSPDNRIVIAYGHSRRRLDLGLAAQREILRQDVVIDGMIPGFSAYDGAQAVGSVSDLYCCQPTARAFRHLDTEPRPGGALHIYTHGEQSAESRPGDSAGIVPLLPLISSSGPERTGLVSLTPGSVPGIAVTVSLAKLLDSGVHSSVIRRADEFVADLRDDPGPWLLRAMLALNARRAAFIVSGRHEGLDGLTAGTGPWGLARAKFRAVSASRVPGHDLTCVRCELADDAAGGTADAASVAADAASGTAGDPGHRLARYIGQRAHGRLRNVWREGLIELTGRTTTKREANDLIDAHASGWAAALALRLIDLPASRFPALQAALSVSASAASRRLACPIAQSGALTGRPSALDGVRTHRVAAFAQAGDYALDIGGGPVLAELGLRLDSGDQHLDSDDRPELAVDVGARRVVDRPRLGTPRLVLDGEPADEVFLPRRVVVDGERPVDVRGHVIPGRHYPAVLGLGRVPGRANVGVGPADDRQRLAVGGEPPLVVVPRDMSLQCPEVSGSGYIQERQHGRNQPVVRHRHQVGRAVIQQQVGDRRLVRREVGWYVHDTPFSPAQVNRSVRALIMTRVLASGITIQLGHCLRRRHGSGDTGSGIRYGRHSGI
jgi:hypothetical protein